MQDEDGDSDDEQECEAAGGGESASAKQESGSAEADAECIEKIEAQADQHASSNGRDETCQAGSKRRKPTDTDDMERSKWKKAKAAGHGEDSGDGDGDTAAANRDKAADGKNEGAGTEGGVPRAVRWVFARLSHIARKSGGDRRSCVFRYGMMIRAMLWMHRRVCIMSISHWVVTVLFE
jgi:hypothetical protein